MKDEDPLRARIAQRNGQMRDLRRQIRDLQAEVRSLKYTKGRLLLQLSDAYRYSEKLERLLEEKG